METRQLTRHDIQMFIDVLTQDPQDLLTFLELKSTQQFDGMVMKKMTIRLFSESEEKEWLLSRMMEELTNTETCMKIELYMITILKKMESSCSAIKRLEKLSTAVAILEAQHDINLSFHDSDQKEIAMSFEIAKEDGIRRSVEKMQTYYKACEQEKEENASPLQHDEKVEALFNRPESYSHLSCTLHGNNNSKRIKLIQLVDRASIAIIDDLYVKMKFNKLKLADRFIELLKEELSIEKNHATKDNAILLTPEFYNALMLHCKGIENAHDELMSRQFAATL